MAKTILAIVLAILTAATAADAAPRTKNKQQRASEPAPSVTYDGGTPIIMQGFKPSRAVTSEPMTTRAERPVRIPRGSSSTVPPPMPSPYSANSPPSPSALQGTQVYKPPAVNSFSDRVTNCIHSAPLNAGVGNNPSNPQAYVRQCAN